MLSTQPRLSRRAIARAFLRIHPLRSIDFRGALPRSRDFVKRRRSYVINPLNLCAERLSRNPPASSGRATSIRRTTADKPRLRALFRDFYELRQTRVEFQVFVGKSRFDSFTPQFSYNPLLIRQTFVKYGETYYHKMH